MALVRGPHTIKWGSNEITDIEEIDLSLEVDSEELTTLQGRTIEIDGNYKVSATLTLLGSDIASLALIVPQYHVANGEVLSTGETVTNADGAIDFNAKSCSDSVVYNDFDIEACGNPAQVFRIVNARTRIDGIEIDDKIIKVVVKIIGDAPADEAVMQSFIKGTIAVVS